jgi:hypothetical protein
MAQRAIKKSGPAAQGVFGVVGGGKKTPENKKVA